jgi:transcriptional regulator with XRE-family HTH domain
MNDFVEAVEPPESAIESTIGDNLRSARLEKGWSMRELAAEAEVSPSLISQIENGRTMPSVRTLYSLAEALSLPVTKHLDQPVLRRKDRPRIPLQGGIIWERLTQSAEQAIELIQTEYPAGASSGNRMSRHAGREFGLVLEGELTLELGFDTYVLQSGDSITFDSTRPHRLVNNGSFPMRAIWVVWEK